MTSKTEERVLKFKRNVEALNKQFLEWCSSQITSKPDRLLATETYSRAAARLRLEFSDIISSSSEDEKEHSFQGRTYAPLLSLMPACHTKTIHFIRHGEGWHNIGLANHDAQLTPRGWQQAHALGRHMQNYEITRDVQLVVVSPLFRALETAAGVFGVAAASSPTLGKESPTTAAASAPAELLMIAQSEVPEVRCTHPAVNIKRPGLEFLANELCRERLGPSSCDSRRKCSESAAFFPGIDFSLIKDDADPHWRPGNVEPEEAVVLRGRQFLQWLMSLPQSNIAVVTHSAFLWFTLSGFGSENIRPVREKLQRWYENCEMRSVVLSDGGSAAVVAALDSDYRGGHVVAEPQQALMEAEAEKGKSDMKNNGRRSVSENGEMMVE
jgi:broad specificity phosphatase PhoE